MGYFGVKERESMYEQDLQTGLEQSKEHLGGGF